MEKKIPDENNWTGYKIITFATLWFLERTLQND
jgi:hypothetical protein